MMIALVSAGPPKPWPLTVNVPPLATTVGEMLVMLGAGEATTVKLPGLVAVPSGVVTATGPVLAAVGTVTTSSELLAD